MNGRCISRVPPVRRSSPKQYVYVHLHIRVFPLLPPASSYIPYDIFLPSRKTNVMSRKAFMQFGKNSYAASLVIDVHFEREPSYPKAFIFDTRVYAPCRRPVCTHVCLVYLFYFMLHWYISPESDVPRLYRRSRSSTDKYRVCQCVRHPQFSTRRVHTYFSPPEASTHYAQLRLIPISNVYATTREEKGIKASLISRSFPSFIKWQNNCWQQWRERERERASSLYELCISFSKNIFGEDAFYFYVSLPILGLIVLEKQKVLNIFIIFKLKVFATFTSSWIASLQFSHKFVLLKFNLLDESFSHRRDRPWFTCN